MRKYFVSYNFKAKDGSIGYGCCELNMLLPVRDMEDIKVMIKEVKRLTKFPGIVIINWRRFEEPAGLLGFPTTKDAS